MEQCHEHHACVPSHSSICWLYTVNQAGVTLGHPPCKVSLLHPGADLSRKACQITRSAVFLSSANLPESLCDSAHHSIWHPAKNRTPRLTLEHVHVHATCQRLMSMHEVYGKARPTRAVVKYTCCSGSLLSSRASMMLAIHTAVSLDMLLMSPVAQQIPSLHAK